MKKVPGTILRLIVLIGAASVAATALAQTPATPKERRVLLVDDFNAARQINLIGGEMGGDGEVPGTCQLTRVNDPDSAFGGAGGSLRLDVDVSPPNSYSFLWLKLGPVTGLTSGTIDLAPYNYLSFWIKGTSGREKVKLELHEDANQDGTFVFGQDRSYALYLNPYLSGPLMGAWQKVVIPLKHFRQEPIHQAIELVLTFEHAQGNRQERLSLDEFLLGFHPALGSTTVSQPSGVEAVIGIENGAVAPGYRLRSVNPLTVTTNAFERIPDLESIVLQYATGMDQLWHTIDTFYQPTTPVRSTWVTAGLPTGDQYQVRAVGVTLTGQSVPLATASSLAVGQLTDEELLEEMARKTFDFFWNESNPKTGLFADATGGGDCSIASCGFGLTALVIGAQRGWVSREEAQARALKTITTFMEQAEGQFGFFYHFLQMDTAQRAGNSEVSTIDTALALCGMLTAGEYFGGEIKERADEVYRRVDWPQLMHQDPQSPNYLQFSTGWFPGQGLLKSFWDYYSDETALINLLAIGSPTHPVSPEVFYAWPRVKGRYEGGQPFVYSWDGGLFTYQYAHGWVDFRSRRDRAGIDWWQNSIDATIASRQFSIDEAVNFPTYGPNSWGITSYMLPTKYTMHHGAFPNGSGIALHDGTISPSGPAGSLPFTPELSLAALKHFYYNHPQLWGEYGFKDSFNLKTGWVAPRYYGLGQGITLLMIENYRSGLVWATFMKHPFIQRAMELAQFTPSPVAPPEGASPVPASTSLEIGSRPSNLEQPAFPEQPHAAILPKSPAMPVEAPARSVVWLAIYAGLCLAVVVMTVLLLRRATR